MSHLSLCVEQLDLSVKQLDFNAPSYDRFSLILTDNIVELILHRQCKRLILRDDMWKSSQKQKYSERTRGTALGRVFKEKTKFCKNENLISEEEKVFINTCHDYRNVLYHVGIKYDDMLHSLAILYHQLGCELFQRLTQCVVLPGDKYSKAVGKHLNNFDKHDLDTLLENANQSLSKDGPDLEIPFSQVLSKSALSALDNLEETLASLVNNYPREMDEQQIIFRVQLGAYLEDKDTIGEATKISGVEYDNYFRAREYLEQNWRAPIRDNPIPKWKTRAKNLKTETNNFLCMAKYDTLRNAMSFFDNAVNNAAFASDRREQIH